MEVSSGKRSLPDSAYRPLKEGETYTPYIPPDVIIPEITRRSVIVGAIMAFIFTLATAVAGMRAGTVFEAAIPIAILAIGVGKLFKRKNTILENVIIQSIGAASGLIVAGAIFTLPTLYMLKLAPGYLEVFLTSLLGGMLGVLFLIPLRKYFVADQHGLLPFPEGTAVNEILVTGERAGKQAITLVIAMLVGGLYDFCADALRMWGTHFTWRVFGDFAKSFTDNTKMLFQMSTTTFFLGLGYIIGLRYATIIVMGSFFSWMVLVPAFGYAFAMFPEDSVAVQNTIIPVANLTPETIFGGFVRFIGIGAIAAAGILGILKNAKVIVTSFGIGFKGIFGRKAVKSDAPRTERDISMTAVIGLIGLTLALMAVFFYFVTGSYIYMVAGLLIVLVISFLFTSVAARAIAIVGVNPVSGMTLLTLIISSVVLVSLGLSGNSGMFIALVIGGVVCTSLSMAGGFVTDLKVGYWLGASPYQQERWKFLGVLVSAATVGMAILLIHHAFGFTVITAAGLEIPNPAMPAPQANVMRTIIEPLMSPEARIPWLLFGVGILLALFMNWLKVPALAFGLGMYLPQEINTPLLLGAFAAFILAKSTKEEALSKARVHRGTLIASGFIAGSALMKIVEAVLRIVPVGSEVIDGVQRPISILLSFHRWANVELTPEINNFILGGEDLATLLGLVFILIVTAWLLLYSWRAKADEESPTES